MECPFEPRLLGVFVLTGLALNVTPGPDMLFVLACGANRGRAGGLRAALGISAGSCVHTAAAVAGLSAVLASSSVAFAATKLAGAAYLVWLGLRSFLSRERSGKGQRNLAPIARTVGQDRVFERAMMTNVLNPKVALFFLALVPQFVSPERGHVALQFLLLGCVFNTTGTLVNAVVGIFAGEIARKLADSPRWKRMIDGATAAIFIALGLRLALGERR
jgi:threonine/homoserine/homoserine lactone efflux protein